MIVLDDNLVFGNISEAARNLLVHSGVSEFVFASVCNFGPEYFAQNIELSSDANVFQGVLNSQWKVIFVYSCSILYLALGKSTHVDYKA